MMYAEIYAEMIFHHLINGGLSPARVDDVIRLGTVCCGRHSEAYTLCEIRRKFIQLCLRLFKAFLQYVADAFLLF